MSSPPSETEDASVRVRLIVGWLEVAPTALSGLAGLAPPHVGMILRNGCETPKRKTAERLGAVTGTSAVWIQVGAPPMLEAPTDATDAERAAILALDPNREADRPAIIAHMRAALERARARKALQGSVAGHGEDLSHQNARSGGAVTEVLSPSVPEVAS